MTKRQSLPQPVAARSRKAASARPAADSLIALLERLGGAGAGEAVRRLADDTASIEQIAREIAGSAAVEELRKLVRTTNIMVSERVEADYAYVGLPREARDYDFALGFETFVRPRIGKRADGFATIFKQLAGHPHPLIIETGCLRVPNNWEGDGQSSFLFDWYARENRGTVITIDINPDSIDSVRRACSGVTSVILNDSVAALDMLSTRIAGPASLLYLDSFDLDLTNPMPSAIHHAKELMAASRLIGPGTIVCVDDFNVPPLDEGGKGLIVDQFMHAIRANVLHSGYQKIWQI